MDNVTLADVQAHYKNTHTSRKSTLRYCWTFTLTAKQVIKSILGSLELAEGDGCLPLPEEAPHKLDKALYIPNESVENIYFQMGFPCIDVCLIESRMHYSCDFMLTETLYSRIWGLPVKGLV